MFPSNEAETIALYRLMQNRIGWRIIKEQKNAFPDAILESDGHRLTCEFEYLSRNFKHHGHPVEGCDLIICWQDNWPDCPLPVQELRPYAKREASIIDSILWSRRLASVVVQEEDEPERTLREKPILQHVFEWEEEEEKREPIEPPFSEAYGLLGIYLFFLVFSLLVAILCK